MPLCSAPTPLCRCGVARRLRLAQVALYLGVVVMLNLAGARFFARLDLTTAQVHSLSAASVDVVQTLREPLTVRAFFSRDLPVPYNNVAQQLEDLLEAYTLAAGPEFNYEIHWVDDASASADQEDAIALAEQYRISPVRIQEVEQDQVTVSQAYMGVALVHGDLVQRVAALTSADQIELRMTDRILSLSQQVSALAGLQDGIRVDVIVSSSLLGTSPAMQELVAGIPQTVDSVNDQLYGQVSLRQLDPDTDAAAAAIAATSGLSALAARGDEDGGRVAYAGLSVAIGNERFPLDLFFGGSLGLQLMAPDEIGTKLLDVVASALGTQREIGYLADFDTPPYRGRTERSPPVESVEPNLANFFELVSTDYRLRGLLLESVSIPAELDTVLVVAPQQSLSEWTLYQLDQLLMRGKSLMVFQDPLDIFIPGGADRPTGPTRYLPRRTGLEDLLAHHGVALPTHLVMDEQSFRVVDQDTVSGQPVEFAVLFAPTVSVDNMNTDHPSLAGVDTLQLLNTAPLALTTPADAVEAVELFRTSDGAWVLEQVIDLSNPQVSGRPPDWTPRSFPLAYLLEGTFSSFFDGRPLPEPPPGVALGEVDLSGSFLAEGVPGRPGRLFVIGGSAVLGNNVLGSDVSSPNARFLLNLLDHLAGSEYRAEMRIKGQGYQRLPQIDDDTRARVKTLNMVLPPVMAAVAGGVVWLVLRRRRSLIRREFQAPPTDG